MATQENTGSLGMPLGEVAQTLADSSPKEFRKICPHPVLLEIPPAILPDDLRKISPDTPTYMAAKLARERVRLLREGAPLEKARLHFMTSTRVVVGRSPKVSDIVLVESRSVSRRHASVFERVGWQIVDESTHGTSVEGEALKPKVPELLVCGQVIHFATVGVIFITPQLLRELALSMVEGGRDREADQPVSPSNPLPVDQRVYGETIRDFLARATSTPGFLESLASCASPFLVQIPVESVDAVAPTRDRLSETQMDGELDPIEHTQPISLSKLKELQRTRKGLDAEVHVLAARDGGPQIMVGREGACDVVLGSTTVSTQHAMIYQGRDGMWRIVDTESQNGTYVNGTRLPTGLKMHLKGGERLWFAGYRVLFLLPDQLKRLLEHNLQKKRTK